MANMSNGRLILSASRSIRGLLRPGLLAAQKCPALTSNILAKTHQSQQQNFLVRKELHTSANLRNVEGQLAPELKERIEKMIGAKDVVVFMKGVPEQPRCGFSNAVVQIMRMHDVTFDGHNILDDEDLRQGIKVFSNWPTIPQVYFKGDFIGGCDILLQMHQNGELIEELEKIGIKSALVKEEEK